jgi:hypothetical protein
MKKMFPCFFRDNKVKNLPLENKKSIASDICLNPELKKTPPQLAKTR